jgi:hypothetical protein
MDFMVFVMAYLWFRFGQQKMTAPQEPLAAPIAAPKVVCLASFVAGTIGVVAAVVLAGGRIGAAGVGLTAEHLVGIADRLGGEVEDVLCGHLRFSLVFMELLKMLLRMEGIRTDAKKNGSRRQPDFYSIYIS